ncbi:copper chaperone PCu(A)C [Devosia sp.]|uniref:copper chaperone PCu(A)C n=1 Tax=Devosia sp. TaxID=1871048 RepID=UPI003BAA08F5
MTTPRFPLIAALALLFAASPALAEDTNAMASPMAMDAPMLAMALVVAGSLEISNGYTRATLPKAPVGGGYITVVNKGTEADRLISVTSPFAKSVSLHDMKMDGTMMKMAEMPDGIEIPAGSTVTLAPGGLHMMFMGLTQPFVEGQSVPVTLAFEKAGSVEIQLTVGAINADMSTMH